MDNTRKKQLGFLIVILIILAPVFMRNVLESDPAPSLTGRIVQVTPADAAGQAAGQAGQIVVEGADGYQVLLPLAAGYQPRLGTGFTFQPTFGHFSDLHTGQTVDIRYRPADPPTVANPHPAQNFGVTVHNP